MDATTNATPQLTPSRLNPALWAMIGIPAATVVASAFTLGMAYRGAEPELPERYAWEGAALDQDLARATRARDLGLGAAIDLQADGRVVVRLTDARDAAASTVTDAGALTLHLTHTTRPALDRSLRLTRGAEPRTYVGRWETLPTARWLVQLDDDRGEWRLRGRLETPDGALRLGH